jgi:hypothetical protein
MKIDERFINMNVHDKICVRDLTVTEKLTVNAVENELYIRRYGDFLSDRKSPFFINDGWFLHISEDGMTIKLHYCNEGDVTEVASDVYRHGWHTSKFDNSTHTIYLHSTESNEYNTKSYWCDFDKTKRNQIILTIKDHDTISTRLLYMKVDIPPQIHSLELSDAILTSR